MKGYLTNIIIITLTLAALGFLSGCEKPPENDYPTVDRLAPGIFLEEERAVLPEGVELRKVYDKGIELTKESEGFVGKLYNDAASYCTIGYGHLIKLAPCDGNEPPEFRAGIDVRLGTEILSARPHYCVAELYHIHHVLRFPRRHPDRYSDVPAFHLCQRRSRLLHGQ